MSSLRFSRTPLYGAILFGILGIAALLLPRVTEGLPMADMGDTLAVMFGGATILFLIVSLYMGSREGEDEDEEHYINEQLEEGEVSTFSMMDSPSSSFDMDDDAPAAVGYGFTAEVTEAPPGKMTREEKKAISQAEKQRKKEEAERAKFEKNAQKEAAKAEKNAQKEAAKAAKKGGVVAVEETEEGDWFEAIKNPHATEEERFPETAVPMGYTAAEENPDFAMPVGAATDFPMYEVTPAVVPLVVLEEETADEVVEDEVLEDEVPDAEGYDVDAAPEWATAAYTDPSFAVPFTAPDPEMEEAISVAVTEAVSESMEYAAEEGLVTEEAKDDFVVHMEEDTYHVTDEAVIEEIATDEYAAEVVADEYAAEVVADEYVAEVVTDEYAAEVVAEEVATDEYVAEVVSDEYVAEVVAEEVATDEYVAEVVAEEVATDEYVAEVVAEEVATDEYAAEVATDVALVPVVVQAYSDAEGEDEPTSKFDADEIVTSENINGDEEYDIVEEEAVAPVFEEDKVSEDNYLTYEQTGEDSFSDDNVEDRLEKLASEMETLIVTATREVRTIRESNHRERDQYEAERTRLSSALEAARSEVDRMAEDLAENSAAQRDVLNSQSILMQAEIVASRARLEREQAKARLRQVRLAIMSKSPVDEDMLAIVEKTLSDFDDIGEQSFPDESSY